MTVYVVTSGHYSDYGIVAIFSSMELARKFMADVPDNGYNDVEEWVVDAFAGFIRREKFTAVIDLKSGEIWDQREWPLECAEAGQRSSEPNFWYRGPVGDISSPQISCYSFVSADHACKLAVEARQQWLRENQYEEVTT